ncbi:MAG: hypothetical protein LBP98_08135 [Tannerella sp.]|jgi:hypothetical protein|nr:hypothetical protein [Tannerella sp.]
MKKSLFFIAVWFCTAATLSAQTLRDRTGAKIGAIKSNGAVENKNGAKIGRFDGDKIYDASGRAKGRINGTAIFDANGRKIGAVSYSGDVQNANGSRMGKVAEGKVRNANGQIIGQYEGIRRNDYVACYFFFRFFSCVTKS